MFKIIYMWKISINMVKTSLFYISLSGGEWGFVHLQMSIFFWIGNLVWTKRSKVKFRCILNGMCLDISKCSKASTMDTKSFQGDPLSRLCHILVVFRQWMAQQVGRRLGAKKGKTAFVPILFSSLCRRRISWSCCHVFPGSRYPCPFFDRGNNHELPWKKYAFSIHWLPPGIPSSK